MKGRRTLTAILIGIGVLVCTFSDTGGQPAAAPIDGYHVLAADFHVHTLVGDGGLAPWDARREAQRRGLDVIAITNHNQVLAGRLHRRLFRGHSLPLVLIGEEVTAPYHHILAIGISKRVEWNQSAAATIDAIHTQGGVAIAAHPQENSVRDFDAPALSQLDAAERAHPGMHRDEETSSQYAAFFARARQHNPRVSPVGDSDFHFTGEIGLCRTYVLTPEISEAAVLDALRNGRTVAYDERGDAYGDNALVGIVQRSRRAQEARPIAAWADRANTVGALMVWIGTVGLVLLGPGPVRSGRGR